LDDILIGQEHRHLNKQKQNEMKNNKTIEADKAKELALVTAVIINEDILNGTLFQTFDTAYYIAKMFVNKHGYEKTDWGVDAEFDEAVIEFASNYRNTWV
jgi:hypothetical protein